MQACYPTPRRTDGRPMPVCENAWGETHYSVIGSGHPVLLIHGVGARQEGWERIAATMSRNFMVVRYDLRGHGSSSKVPGPFSLHIFAKDATDLLDHLGIVRGHVAGLSLGGANGRTTRPASPPPTQRWRPVKSRRNCTVSRRRRWSLPVSTISAPTL